MSATLRRAARSSTVSLRRPFSSRVLPCQCGVCRSSSGAHAEQVHEYAHNLQQELGIFDNSVSESATPFELPADCLVGAWAHSVYEQGDLEPGDLEEAAARRWPWATSTWATRSITARPPSGATRCWPASAAASRRNALAMSARRDAGQRTAGSTRRVAPRTCGGSRAR